MIPTLETLSKQIAKDLKGSRLQGKSGPDNPVTSQTMCTAYMALYKWNITDREIRAATKHLVENKVPIGTTLSGVYWVLTSEEWEPTLEMLMPKFLSIKSKIDSIQEMQKEMKSHELGQEQIPLIQLFDEKLNIQKIT
jgi:hypothetical protein